MMRNLRTILILLVLVVSSCTNDLEKLTPPAERSEASVEQLKDDLTSPANGWVLNYEPTDESGVFYMVLDFNDDGTVRIQSDVPGDDNAYFDQTIAYRIESRLSLELIFETYGVFHYLFEENASTFGAEFEFYYVGNEGGNLRFISKSDGQDDQSELSFVPATSSSTSVFSQELAENLLAYDTISSLFARTTQQVAIDNEDISIFWSIDLDLRNIELRAVAEGLTTTDIVANDNMKNLDHKTGYGFFDGKLVLTQPLTFDFSGKSYTFEEMTLNNFTEDGEIFCDGGTTNSPVYTGSVGGLGSATLYKTLFDPRGTEFVPQSESPYSVNVFFVADANGFSMSENGSINEHFPNSTGFAFNYGYNDDDPDDPEPAYAVGLYIEDDNGQRVTYLREFDPTTTDENKVQVTFNGNYYPSDISAEDQANLESITDEIFGTGGGEVYALYYEVPTQPDLVIYTLYNPCNNYEFLLVE